MEQEKTKVVEQEIIKEENALSLQQCNNNLTMWNDKETMSVAVRMAEMLSKSTSIPQSYQNKSADCLLAIDLANRLGLSPITIMQNSQIIQGNFSWKGVACKALIENSGRYKKTRYVEVGTKGTDDWGMYLQAIDKEGEEINGVTVTIGMAKKEGWYSKSGSKWQTMPELMLKYRASAFFMRTECATSSMGFLTTEELEDISVDTNNKSNLTNLLDKEINKNNK